MSRFPTKADLRRCEEAETFQSGIKDNWIRLVCRGCGADYATSRGPFIFDPCANCGTPVGHITRMRTA